MGTIIFLFSSLFFWGKGSALCMLIFCALPSLILPKGNSLVFGCCYNYLSIMRNPRTNNLPSQTCCQREMHCVRAGSSFLVV